MFQCFKVNANIDVSLASTPRESFARVQGPSHCTVTLPVFDKLRMLCSFVWVPNCCCQKARYAEYQTLWEKYNDNDKSTISAEQHLKIQLRIPKKRRTRVRRNRHSPTPEKHRWEFTLTWYFFQNPFCECRFSDAECKTQSCITPWQHHFQLPQYLVHWPVWPVALLIIYDTW